MLSQPLHDDTREVNLLTQRQLTALGNAMPFLQAATTTAASGVLGDERRKDAMAHGCLLAIVGDKGWSQPPGYGFSRALLYLFPALVLDIALSLALR